MVVTTESNQTVARVHNRMALIVPQELEDVYLSEGNKEDLLYTVAKPYDDSLMTAEELAAL